MGKYLTNKQRRELLSELRLERFAKHSDRIKCVLLLDGDKSPESIAEYLFISCSSIRNYLKRYQDGGIEQLVTDDHKGSLCYLGSDELEELSSYLQEHLHTSTAKIVEYVNAYYGVNYSLSGLRYLLYRLGFVYKKPKAVPGRASQAAQEEFLNSISALLDGAANTGLFYIDGTHPQHNSQMDYGWIKKGQDKEVKTNTGRKRVNINGIINAHDPTDVLIDESDSINAQSTIRLLRHLEEKTDYLDKIYVVADNARYYRSRLVKEFLEGSKIKVLFLPPYSPNLNLIERLWRLLKKEVLSNRYFDKFADFRNAILSFFDHLEKYKPKLDSLMTLNFHTVG